MRRCMTFCVRMRNANGEQPFEKLKASWGFDFPIAPVSTGHGGPTKVKGAAIRTPWRGRWLDGVPLR